MKKEANELKTEYTSVLPMSDMILGKTSLLKHIIKLTDKTLLKECYWQIPPIMYEEVREHLKEMLKIGVIQPLHSPWASTVVLVHKKDGKLWFCIDLRKLNVHTIKDSYSLPRIEDTLDGLKWVVWFTSLDLRSGYWQVEMEEASKPLMAFTAGPLGFYECDHMSFGMVNAPAIFQRLMETCLDDLQLNCCLIYLDDVVVFSKMPKDHLVQLRVVFEKLTEAGLKLKPKKSLTCLGHWLLEGGIKTDDSKIKVIGE